MKIRTRRPTRSPHPFRVTTNFLEVFKEVDIALALPSWAASRYLRLIFKRYHRAYIFATSGNVTVRAFLNTAEMLDKKNEPGGSSKG